MILKNKHVAVFLGFLAFLPSLMAADSIDELLKAMAEYKKFPDLIEKDLSPQQKQILSQDVPKEILSSLSAKVLESRLKGLDFQSLQRAQKNSVVLEKNLKDLTDKMKTLSVTEDKQLRELELRKELLDSQKKKNQITLFMSSVNLNFSVREALATITATQKQEIVKKKELKIAAEKAPKLPGIQGESYEQRMKLPIKERYFLTPVDPEFYDTQVGKKIEKDLKGRAQFWSYDYDKDELYVSVDKQVGRLSVKDLSDGISYLQTRVGDEFNRPLGSDSKVDKSTAEGRFLMKNKNEETLFGIMKPVGQPAAVNESDLKKGSGGSSEHDHKHE